jgi:hypothetical protein
VLMFIFSNLKLLTSMHGSFLNLREITNQFSHAFFGHSLQLECTPDFEG